MSIKGPQAEDILILGNLSANLGACSVFHSM